MRVLTLYLQGNKCPYVGAAIVRAIGVDDLLIKRISINPCNHTGDIIAHIRKRATKEANYKEQWYPLYARMNYMRTLLDVCGTANDAKSKAYRKALAYDILGLEKEINHIWALADYHATNGVQYKADDTTIPDDPIVLARMIQTQKRKLRRLKQQQRNEPTDELTTNIKAIERWIASL